MNNEIQSPEEIQLRAWMTANKVYPGDLTIQSLIINSFYSEFEEEEPNDKDLIELEDADPDEIDISEGFDYRAFEKSDEEEDELWQETVKYGLNNTGKFLTYIDAEWRQ